MLSQRVQFPSSLLWPFIYLLMSHQHQALTPRGDCLMVCDYLMRCTGKKMLVYCKYMLIPPKTVLRSGHNLHQMTHYIFETTIMACWPLPWPVSPCDVLSFYHTTKSNPTRLVTFIGQIVFCLSSWCETLNLTGSPLVKERLLCGLYGEHVFLGKARPIQTVKRMSSCRVWMGDSKGYL